MVSCYDISVKSEMNRHGPKHQVSTLGMSTTSPVDSSALLKISSLSTGRLIVLIPADSNYGSAIQRIWQLATATSRRVHLLGLCKDMAQELSLRRQLIAMSALLNDGGIPTEAKIEFGTRWIDAVRRNYKMGDIIVCFTEQRDGPLHKPLKQVLEENLDAPIVILSDLYPQCSSRLNVLSQLLLWVGLIGIIAGAFLLQTRIMSLPRDWSQTTLILLSVFAEFWLIWGWNNLFS
jgi:hypothetical protein